MRPVQIIAGFATFTGLITACLAAVIVLRDQAPPTPPYREALAEDVLRQRLRDPALVEQGRKLFAQNCTLCHGVQGQGVTGPNLRDDQWINGSDARHIVESIANGNPAKGMAPWRQAFAAEKLHALAAFVASLRGSEDGSGKAGEGTRQPLGW
jgi:cytochrome c oxidase cbb3-type subunit 3